MSAAIVWLLMTPASDIQPRHSSSITRAYVVTSRPRPPYSAGTSAPKRPSSRMRATKSCGKASSCSSAAATGRTSASTNSRTAPTTGWSMSEQILQYGSMPLDDLVLGVQRVFDRFVRRLRLGPPPAPGRRRLLIVQIDGLSRAVLEEAMARGRAPFLARLLRRRGYL